MPDQNEQIVVALMLCHAMSRVEAEEVLRQRDVQMLDDAMAHVQAVALPERLEGYGRYWRRVAWMDGRNDAVNALFSDKMRLEIKSRRYREGSRA